jgi:thymidylate synthase
LVDAYAGFLLMSQFAVIRALKDKSISPTSITPSEMYDLSNYFGVTGQSCIEKVAGTIFPQSVWRLSQGDRHQFFQNYIDMLPHIKRCKPNKRGVYFQRMVAFASDRNETTNQLEHIIETWTSGNHRHSALQAGIFDPRSDHSHCRQQGFPCLQQVAFHPHGTNGKDGMSVVAFYANQTVVEKAYGNYLGLYRLGQFMANEMGLKLKEVVCIASALKINNNLDKSSCESEVKAIKAVLKNVGE